MQVYAIKFDPIKMPGLCQVCNLPTRSHEDNADILKCHRTEFAKCYVWLPNPKGSQTQEGKNSRKDVSSAVSLKTTSGTLECGLPIWSRSHTSPKIPKAFFRLHCGSSSENPLHYAFIFPQMVLSGRFLAHSEMSFKRSCQMLRGYKIAISACPF
ncbi:hypothetical protein CEXT_341361 [Caerostris extrusa]|uniref:Uncharacterized protein n=1 Tax=Caerostris extrusa TaxID=172846 RepID=A0AAV4SXV6_CAEEX|nr:hypothetical protein CEXT_341361 [Caerostris extrusa]